MKAHKNGRPTVQQQGLTSLPYSCSTRLLSHVCRVTSSVLNFWYWRGLVWGSVDPWVGVAAEGNCVSLAGQTRTLTYESPSCETSMQSAGKRTYLLYYPERHPLLALVAIPCLTGCINIFIKK